MCTSLAILLSVFRMVVIPVQFQDLEFSTEQTALEQMLSSAQEYFDRQFREQGQFEFTLSPLVTLSHNYSYYGSNYTDRKDVMLYAAVREACQLSSTSVDFSLFDGNNDGYVDNIMLLFAGPSEDSGAGADYIYQQHSFLHNDGNPLTLSGKTIDSFSACCELNSDAGENLRPAGVGFFCHETAHALGLKDLYDTDRNASGGSCDALHSSSLMDSGCKNDDGNTPPDFSALEYHLLSLGAFDELSLGTYTLSPLLSSGKYLRALTDKEGEEYLMSCSDEGQLCIYHLDRSDNPSGYSDYYSRVLTAAQRWEYNQVNCNPNYPCAELVAVLPDGQLDSFGSDTTPSFRFRSGHSSSMALTDIHKNSDNSLSFNVIEPITIEDLTIYQDAVSLKWKAEESLREQVILYEILCTDGVDTLSFEAGPNSSVYTIDKLKAHTDYTVKLRMRLGENEAFSVSSSFTTKAYIVGTYPYIYLSGVLRNKDGSFNEGTRIPLRIFNAGEVDEVLWYFNGNSINADSDGYYTIHSSGTLKAVIYYPDGSSETIIKEIIL